MGIVGIGADQRAQRRDGRGGGAIPVLVAGRGGADPGTSLGQLEGIGGRYFEDCNEAEMLPTETVATAASGVASCALDPHAAERLWELSLATARA